MAFCNKHGIKVDAYAPMGDGQRSNMLSNPLWAQIATAHGLTADAAGIIPQTWELMTGADVVLPRSHDAKHQAINLNQLFAPDGTLAVQLTEEDIAAISSVNVTGGYKKVYGTQCQPVSAGGGGVLVAHCPLAPFRRTPALGCSFSLAFFPSSAVVLNRTSQW